MNTDEENIEEGMLLDPEEEGDEPLLDEFGEVIPRKPKDDFEEGEDF